MKDARRKDLEKVIAEINKKYGEGTVAEGCSVSLDIPRIRSGITAIDLCIGGGIPRGAIIEFYGRESGGKTTTALLTVAAYQRQGLTCAYIDLEHSFDEGWAGTLGVDMKTLIISQPDTLEKSVDVIDSLVRSGAVDLVVYDSIAAAVPSAEMEKSAFDMQMALQARLFAKMCRKLQAALQPDDISDCSTFNKTTIIFINQVREKIGTYARGYETPGGHALKHAYKVRIQLTTTDRLKNKETGDCAGIEVTFRVVKNKTWIPYKTGTYKLYFNGEVDNDDTIITEAKKHKIVIQRGPMYDYGDITSKGIEKFIQDLKEKKLFDKITSEVYDILLKKGKEDGK